MYVFPTRIAHHPATAFVGLALQCETRAAETVVEFGDHVVAPAFRTVRFTTRERQNRVSFDTLFIGRQAERVEHGRHHVDARDEARLCAAAGGVGTRRRIVDDHRHALHGVVEQFLLAEPMIAEEVAVVGGEHDQGVLPAAEPFERVPQLAEMVVDLLDQALINRPHGVRHFFTREIGTLFMRTIRGHNRMRIVEFGGLARERQALIERIKIVIRTWRDIGPMRLYVRQMQCPRRVALLLDIADRLIRHVSRFGMRLGHPRRPAHVAHFPAGMHRAAVVFHTDREVAPRLVANVAVRA